MYRVAFIGRVMFFPHVPSDKEVRPSDLESCNLVLFGTKATNSMIEKYSDRLPLQLQSTATQEYGLFCVVPIDGHYVAISSGLPWWTGQTAEGFRFMPAPVIKLQSFKDFILFKTGATNVIAEGYFDNNWNLPETEKAKLKASAAAVVK